MEHRNDASSLRRSTHTSDAQLHRAPCDILRMAEAEPPPLRHWLVHNARLDHRIIDRTIEELRATERLIHEVRAEQRVRLEYAREGERLQQQEQQLQQRLQ